MPLALGTPMMKCNSTWCVRSACRAITQVREAAEGAGFFSVVGHGVPDQVLAILLLRGGSLLATPAPCSRFAAGAICRVHPGRVPWLAVCARRGRGSRQGGADGKPCLGFDYGNRCGMQRQHPQTSSSPLRSSRSSRLSPAARERPPQRTSLPPRVCTSPWLRESGEASSFVPGSIKHTKPRALRRAIRLNERACTHRLLTGWLGDGMGGCGGQVRGIPGDSFGYTPPAPRLRPFASTPPQTRTESTADDAGVHGQKKEEAGAGVPPSWTQGIVAPEGELCEVFTAGLSPLPHRVSPPPAVPYASGGQPP